MHVVCTAPNASNRIDGHLFVPVKVGNKEMLVSEDIPEEKAKRLLTITGFELFRAEPQLVTEAITRFKQDHVSAIERGDAAQAGTIKELQDNCSRLSDMLGKANMKITELQEENNQLKGQVGEPSMSWNRKRLADYAENLGLIVNDQNSKAEILDMIDTRVAQRG